MRSFRKAASAAIISTAVITMVISSQAIASGSSSVQTPFNVVIVAGITGSNAIQGVADEQGMRAAATFMNSHGGLHGRKVDVAVLNDNSDPTTAVSVLQSYLSSHSNVGMVVPGGESNETAALLPVLASHGILALAQEDGGLTSTMTSDAQKFPQQFVVTTPPSLNSEALAVYIIKHHYTSVGIIEENVGYFQSEMAALQQPLAKAQVKTFIVPFAPTALDLTPEVGQIQGDHVDAILVAAVGASAGYALSAINKLGLNVPKIGDAGIASTPVTTLVPPQDYANMETVYFRVEVYVPPAKQSPALKDFLAALKAEHAQESAPFVFYASMWDDLQLLDHAAQQAGTTKEKGLVEALNHLKVTTDPQYIYETHYQYSPSEHENIGASLHDLETVQVGPIIGGQVHPG